MIDAHRTSSEMRTRAGHSSASGPPTPTRLSESIVRFEETLHEFQRQCERAEDMADRLCGPIPKEQAAAMDRPPQALERAPGGSLADQIEGLASRLHNTRGRMQLALDRLQQL